MPSREVVLELREDGGLAPYGGELGRLGLQAGTQFEEAAHIAVVDLCDHDTPLPRRLGEALRDKPAQGLAHRCAGDPQTVGLLHLQEGCARRQDTVEDLRPQLRVCTSRGSGGSGQHGRSVYTSWIVGHE
ncbi:hypothetical protein GCM10010387_51790 [Streptomyces inusitatus]|uniref:Uncharacterized protein n=1 Tax=Streptomyces inusitatus TaxID=68221 RepID=A0A918QIP6_9ACTN|nr:hypothetical protein GCM10010387_51790 [Streptomyces inusitatus]